MNEQIFISIPVDYLKKEKKLLKKYKFNLELKIFSHHLDNYSIYDFVKFNEFVKNLNIKCTFHAPFIDMSPGSFDDKIREVTEERFLKIFDLCAIFNPLNVVFHTGFFEPIEGWFFDRWVERSIITWKKVKRYSKKLNQKFSIENVFEKDFKVHEILLNKINSDFCGICLDVAHHNVFGENRIEDWFIKFKDKIFEFHIHDNDGSFDWHWAVGEGNIDFIKIFNLIKKYSPNAIITLEAHDKETMLKTYENVMKILEKV